MNTKLFNERRKAMSMKRFLVKSSMFTLCLIGFLIHSYFKIRLFYDQEPITEYVNENLDLTGKAADDGELIKLPAISVCFIGSLFKRKPSSSIDGGSLTNQLRSSLYSSQHKHRLPPNVALLDDVESTQFDDDSFSFGRRQMINTRTNRKPQLPRSANQMISVDQAFGLVSKPRFAIKCDLIKATKQRKLTRFTDNPLACEQIAQVIESINYETDQKCFTFFSQLQQAQDVEDDDFLVYRSDLNGGDLVQLRIYFEDDLSSTKGNQAKVQLLIHSNVEMPNFQQMKTYALRSSHNYVVYFDRLAYKRENANQSPCRLYKSETKKDVFSLSYLQQVPTVLMDYQLMLKNHLYKLLFSGGDQPNATKIEDQESQTNNADIEIKKEAPKSQSDCIDKCHLETNRKYCICLPAGVNVRRELLSATDLFCDELRCIQEDLPSSTMTSINNAKNGQLKNDQQTSGSEQLERLYSMSNGQFVSKRYERFKKCILKNNCIKSCEEDRYDYNVNEKADLNLIVQNILSNSPTNATRRMKNARELSSNKKLARNYYPDGFYYDPNYQLTTTSSAPSINKRHSFKHNQPPEVHTPNKQTTSNSSSSSKSAVDDLGRNFYKNSTMLNDAKLNTSIIVQAPKRNQSSLQTTSVFNRRTINDHQSSSQTSAMSDAASNQFKTTISPAGTTDDELNSIDPDSIDDLDAKNDDRNREFTQPSFGKYTSQSRKSFKFATSTQASAGKNENANGNSNTKTNDQGGSDDELDDIPVVDENVEERHNPLKSYQSLISFRNNRNANRTYRQRLAYSLIDLVFDLSLVAVVWLGFSIYLVADCLIYSIVLVFWYFVRLTFCLDWWFKRASRKRRHRIVDSASSTAQLTNSAGHLTNRSSKESVISQELERERTFVKSIP